MRKQIARLLLLALCALLASGTAWAQTSTGQISGTVTDPTGALIPGAKVVIKNQATGLTQETATTSAGAYTATALPPGQYSVTVTASGFQTFVSSNNVVSVGGNLVVNAELKIGSQAQTVTVESSFERLDTTNAMLSGVVSRKEIVELPLNGRNPLNLIIFEPGLVQRSSGSAGSGTHVFGSRDRAHNVTIDGIDANESSVPNPQSNIFRTTPDNVQEYRVVTHNATAEFGRNSGANVALSTRQGTNEFHGDLFYFHRNTALNSQEFFAKAQAQLNNTQPNKPVLLLHQFGGDIGGPVIKNKTFFFASYQGNRIKQAQPITQSFGIPLAYTQSARTGIFRYVRGSITFTPTGASAPVTVNQNDRRLVDSSGNILPGIPLCTGLGGTATSNCIDGFNMFTADPAGIGANPDMLAMFNSFPLPNSFNTVGDGLNRGGFSWNTPSRFKGPFYLVRGDHKINDNHSLSGSFRWTTYDTTEGDLLNSRPQLFPGFAPLGEVFRDSQLLSLSYRAALSPQLVNEFTTGYSRFNFFFSLNESNGVSGTLAAIGQECFGTDSLGNVDTPFCNTPHTQRAVSTIQFIDNLSYIRGSHTFRTGFNIRFYRHNDSRGVPGGFNMSPTITFAQATRNPANGNTAPGNTTAYPDPPGINTSTDRAVYRQAVVEFMGIPARVQQVFQADLAGNAYRAELFTLGTRIRHYDVYVQDEWKMRRNLTLTYGVRWEWKPPAKDCCDRVFVPNQDVLGTQGTVSFTQADSWWGRDNANTFAPRLSVAWQPFADGKTVVRAGWGMAFDTVSSFQVTSVGGKVPGGTLQCFTTVPFGTTPSAQPSGCADIRPLVTANARLPQVLAGLTTGGVFAQPLPPSSPSQNFTPPVTRSGLAPSVGTFDPNLKVPTVHEWNLTVQRELPWNLVAQVGYVGKRGMRLYRAYDINQLFTNQSGFLQSFLIGQNNVFLGCDVDGTVSGSSTAPCAATGAAVPTLLMQLAGCADAAGVPTAACTFLNGRSADFTNNALGNLALQIDTNTLPTANGRNLFPANYFRPNPQFNEIFYFDSGGGSSYHGMIVNVNRRFQRGLTFGFSYTLSKSIDDMSVDPVAATSGGALGNNSRTPTDVRNFAIDRTVSDFDNRHVVSANVLWELPFGKGRQWLSNAPGWVDQIVGGWTITDIFVAQSGEPFTLNSGAATATSTAVQKQSTLDVRGPFIQPGLFDIAGVPGPSVYNLGARITNSADPNFNCRNVLQPDGTATSTFFCIPAPGQHGTSGRNSVYGPGYWNTDIGILKDFRLTERIKLQFRAELFNAFNHANFRNPRNASTGSPTLTSSLFGQTCCIADSVPSSQTIIAVGEPNRTVQFGLKLNF